MQPKALKVILTVFKDEYFSTVCNVQLSPYRFAYWKEELFQHGSLA